MIPFPYAHCFGHLVFGLLLSPPSHLFIAQQELLSSSTIAIMSLPKTQTQKAWGFLQRKQSTDCLTAQGFRGYGFSPSF